MSVFFLGYKVIIVMLVIIFEIKVNVVCVLGGEVVLYGYYFDVVKVYVLEFIE